MNPTHEEHVRDLAITPDGDVVAAGRWDDRASALMLDGATGQVLWEFQTNDDYSELRCVVALDDGSGDVLVAGWKDFDGLLARLSPQGDVLWHRIINAGVADNLDKILDLLLHPDGRVYASGTLADRKAYAWLMADDPGQHQVYLNLPAAFPNGRRLEVATPSALLIAGFSWGGYTQHGTVAMVNVNGPVQWVHQAMDLNYAYGVAYTLDGITVFVGPKDVAGPGLRAYVGALDGQGNPLWEMADGVGDEDSIYHGVCPADPAGSNDVYVVGQVYEEIGGPSRQVLRRITSSGDVIWTVYGVDGIQDRNEWRAVTALDNGGVIVAGKQILVNDEADLVIERYDP
ncbi:WD40 repeat domain-containing protein [bacterium]|nr:WD40 repeat domain-containing protein [bacterium]